MSDTFGDAVGSLDDGRVLVGAIRVDTGDQDAGEAYIYDVSRPGAAPVILRNPVPDFRDNFGNAIIGIGNNLVVVGAYKDNLEGSDSGAAHVFNATDGSYLRTLASSFLTSPHWFGRSLEWLGGNVVAVGAPRDDVFAWGGAVHLFDVDDGSHLLRISNPNPVVFGEDQFGRAMDSSSPPKLFISAPRKEIDDVSNIGIAYLFDPTTGGLLQTFNNPEPETSDRFGTAIAALSDDLVAITGFKDNGAAGT